MPGDWGFPKDRTSNVIYANNEAITSLSITLTGSGEQLRFFVGTSTSAEGTYDWEEVIGFISGTAITHTMTAQDPFLKFKAVGLNYDITELRIQVNP